MLRLHLIENVKIDNFERKYLANETSYASAVLSTRRQLLHLPETLKKLSAALEKCPPAGRKLGGLAFAPQKFDPLYLTNRSSEYVQIFTDASASVPQAYVQTA